MKTCQSVCLSLLIRMTQENRSRTELVVMLNPYLSHVVVERLFTVELTAKGEHCWEELELREKPKRELRCCVTHSVLFNNILYIWSTHTLSSPANAFSLTFIENVWGSRLLLHDFTEKNSWISHRFYTQLEHCYFVSVRRLWTRTISQEYWCLTQEMLWSSSSVHNNTPPLPILQLHVLRRPGSS